MSLLGKFYPKYCGWKHFNCVLKQFVGCNQYMSFWRCLIPINIAQFCCLMEIHKPRIRNWPKRLRLEVINFDSIEIETQCNMQFLYAKMSNNWRTMHQDLVPNERLICMKQKLFLDIRFEVVYWNWSVYTPIMKSRLFKQASISRFECFSKRNTELIGL